MDYFDEIVKPPKNPYLDGQYHVEWRCPGLPPAMTKVEWPACVLDGDLDAEWVPLTALDWHSLFPRDSHWRDAAILGLARLAYRIAGRRNPRQEDEWRGDAGGADLFATGLLTIVENIGKDLSAKGWGRRIVCEMKKWRRREKRQGTATDFDTAEKVADTSARTSSEFSRDFQRACDRGGRRGIADTTDPYRLLSAVEAWESCQDDPRSRRVYSLKEAGWTEQEIADELDVKVGVIKRILKKMYAKLGVDPAKRRTRARGRDKPEPEQKPDPFDWDTLARLLEHNARAASDFVRSVKRACVADAAKCGDRDIVQTGEPGTWLQCVKAVMACTDDPLTRQVMERVLARRWTAAQIAAQLGIDDGRVKCLERKLRYEVCVKFGLDPTKCRVWVLGTEDDTEASAAA